MIRHEDWRSVDDLKLEPNALTAVTTIEQNVVVAAGPGAGKTELLAQRADFLLRTGACPYPRRILAISFKVDAARNLRDRVRTRSGGQYAARFDSFTFHAFAKRLIDNYRPALTGQNELRPDYRIDPDTRVHGEQITFDDLVPLALEILASNRYARGALRPRSVVIGVARLGEIEGGAAMDYATTLYSYSPQEAGKVNTIYMAGFLTLLCSAKLASIFLVDTKSVKAAALELSSTATLKLGLLFMAVGYGYSWFIRIPSVVGWLDVELPGAVSLAFNALGAVGLFLLVLLSNSRRWPL
jgi:hypothetical protein